VNKDAFMERYDKFYNKRVVNFGLKSALVRVINKYFFPLCEVLKTKTNNYRTTKFQFFRMFQAIISSRDLRLGGARAR